MTPFPRLTLVGFVSLGALLPAGLALAATLPVAADAAAAEITGTVMVVNTEKRMLTIRTSDGDFEVIHVPDEVRRLDEIQIDDTLTIIYAQAVAVDLQKGTSAAGAPGAILTREVTREQTAKPAGRMEDTLILTGIVEAVDKAKSEVTIRGPEQTVTVTVEDPQLLADVAVGDSVTVAYISAVAARIE